MWSAIAVSMPRWAGAFIAADTQTMPLWVDNGLHYLNMFSGVGMGLIEVLGTAYLLDAWGKMKPRKTHNAKSLDQQWVILTFFVGGLFILMPLILSPYIVARMNNKALSDIGGSLFHIVWSIAVVLSPAFIVGGVAVARDGLVGVSGAETSVSNPVSKETEKKQEETKETPKEKMRRIWKPGMGPTELANRANVSKGYASKYINNGAMVSYRDK